MCYRVVVLDKHDLIDCVQFALLIFTEALCWECILKATPWGAAHCKGMHCFTWTHCVRCVYLQRNHWMQCAFLVFKAPFLMHGTPCWSLLYFGTSFHGSCNVTIGCTLLQNYDLLLFIRWSLVYSRRIFLCILKQCEVATCYKQLRAKVFGAR